MLFQVPYTVKGKGMVVAAAEFTLIRSLDGNLVSSYKDNVNNTTNAFDVTEFQRGDVVSFRLNQALIDKEYIVKNDTLGYIVSNEEQRNLIELKGQMEVLNAQLEFFTTGQKPEDVLIAKESWDLSKQDLITQDKLMARTLSLFEDGVIARQEFEIEENILKVKELETAIARANYLSVTTGEKPEQEKLIRAQIDALSLQIDQINSRISYFTITAPFSGKLSFPRHPYVEGTILSLADTSALVGVVPLLFNEYKYVQPGQRVICDNIDGRVNSIEDMVRMIDFKQAFYVTAIWPYTPDLQIGSFVEVRLEGDSISLLNLFLRRFTNNANVKV
jgi:hypothetical protein